jgi:hypothetical protein
VRCSVDRLRLHRVAERHIAHNTCFGEPRSGLLVAEAQLLPHGDAACLQLRTPRTDQQIRLLQGSRQRQFAAPITEALDQTGSGSSRRCTGSRTFPNKMAAPRPLTKRPLCLLDSLFHTGHTRLPLHRRRLLSHQNRVPEQLLLPEKR